MLSLVEGTNSTMAKAESRSEVPVLNIDGRRVKTMGTFEFVLNASFYFDCTLTVNVVPIR